MPDGTTLETSILEAPTEPQLSAWTYFPSVIYTIGHFRSLEKRS